MTTHEWLANATKRLATAGIATARLDCLVLLEDCLNMNRAQILTYPHLSVTERQLRCLNERVNRRTGQEPLAYIRERTEFYGREFFIDKRVLEPRPETETMIELAKKIAKKDSIETIIDVGTGSGALVITVQLEIPGIKTIGIDIDPACLIVARKNARQYKLRLEFLRGDLLRPLIVSVHRQPIAASLLLCNLPYVPDNFHINQAARAEPRIAIFGGSDGLDLYRRLFGQIQTSGWRPRHILAESLPPQHYTLARVAKAAAYKLVATTDLIQQFETT